MFYIKTTKYIFIYQSTVHTENRIMQQSEVTARLRQVDCALFGKQTFKVNKKPYLLFLESYSSIKFNKFGDV